MISDYFLANIDNDIITYSDPLNNIFDINNFKLERIDEEKELIFDFLNQVLMCKYNGNDFSINIKVIKKEVTSNNIYIQYELSDDVFEYIIDL